VRQEFTDREDMRDEQARCQKVGDVWLRECNRYAMRWDEMRCGALPWQPACVAEAGKVGGGQCPARWCDAGTASPVWGRYFLPSELKSV